MPSVDMRHRDARPLLVMRSSNEVSSNPDDMAAYIDPYQSVRARDDLHPILHLASFWSPERDSLSEIHQRRAEMLQHARRRTLTFKLLIVHSQVFALGHPVA